MECFLTQLLNAVLPHTFTAVDSVSCWNDINNTVKVRKTFMNENTVHM